MIKHCPESIHKEVIKIPRFIYELLDPESLEVRYIGKTKNLKKRYNAHISVSKKKRTRKDCWIQSLAKKGKKPLMRVKTITIEKYINESEVLAIKEGKNLTNQTMGGDGQSNIKPEIISKIKITKCKNKKWNIKSKKSKKVVGYSLETGEIVTFDGAKQAAVAMGMNQSHITSCCRKRKSFLSHKGFVWRYIGESYGV